MKISRHLFIAFLLSFSPQLTAPGKSINQGNSAVKTIDGIVNEVLHIISGKNIGKINLEAFRELFLPTAQFTVLMHDTEEAKSAVETIHLEEFLELLKDPYYEEFEEKELHKVVDEYNGIAQVFQTYQGKDGDGYQEKGITSYQLVFIEDRWWIANLVWTGDSNGVAIPDIYLGK